MNRPVIVEHCFGEPGSGGPITLLQRVLESYLNEKYRIVVMHQNRGAGGLNLPILADFIRILRGCRPDLVHIRGLGNEGFHGALAAKMAGCRRLLVSIHGTQRDLVHGSRHDVRRAVVSSILEPATLRMATGLVTVCDYAARRSLLDPYRGKFLGVVPNGVRRMPFDPDIRLTRRQELGAASDEVVLMTVSRLALDKGFLDLAEALRRLPPTSARLRMLVVGDGPDEAAIQAAFADVGSTTVQFLGRRLDVMELLQAADLFVFPSLHENMSSALLEAMASGLPVVATAVGGTIEVVRRGGGRLVPPAAPGLLAAALAELIADPEQRRVVGAVAKRVVEENYSMDAMIQRLDQVYSGMLAEA